MIYQEGELHLGTKIMKVRASIKKICIKCQIIKRAGVLRVFVKILNTSKDRDN